MNRARLERLLPAIFRQTSADGTPLAAILDVIVDLLAPIQQILKRRDMYFDPHRTPTAFVPFLACWVDLEVLLENVFEGRVLPASQFPTGAARLRELIAQASYLSRWRGTSRGLERFLEIATGVKGFKLREQVLDQDKQPQPFHFELTAPAALKPYTTLVKAIVDLEKPAYVTYQLKFADS